MNCSQTLPQSVFNTQSSSLVEYLKSANAKQQLYPHQVDAVLKLGEYFTQPSPSSNVAVVTLPTGCGGTGVAVLASYALSASRVLVLAPSLASSKQVCALFGSYLIDRGVVTEQNRQMVVPSRSLVTKLSQMGDAMASNVIITNAQNSDGMSSVKITDIPPNGFDLVIVDEAQHYTAATWKVIANHFSNSRLLFLTTNAKYKGKPLLGVRPCYELERSVAVNQLGILRDVKYDEMRGGNENFSYLSVAVRIEYHLNNHDATSQGVGYQGLVLVQAGSNAAKVFSDIYNKYYPGKCAAYTSDDQKNVVDDFKSGTVRVLVTTANLLDDVATNRVSVLGVAYGITPSSRIQFDRFVSKAVCSRSSPADQVDAQVVSHEHFHQIRNFENFEKLVEINSTEE